MNPHLDPPEPTTLAQAQAHAQRQLTAEEFEACLRSERSEEALAEKRSLIEWFTRRYPTPAARSAYARRYSDAVQRARKNILRSG